MLVFAWPIFKSIKWNFRPESTCTQSLGYRVPNKAHNLNSPIPESTLIGTHLSYFFRMRNSITMNVLTIIMGSSLIIIVHKWKASERAIVIDSLTRIPRRQSNYTILNSKVYPMKFMLRDIPGWISCPPAVINSFIKSKFVFTLMSSSWIGMYFRFCILYALFECISEQAMQSSCELLRTYLALLPEA